MTTVTLHKVGKTYPHAAEPVLKEISLEIEAGKLTALLGPSGSGKTTILKTIAGLLDPTSGDIRFDGTSVLGVPPENRNAVMVFQSHLLFPHMSVADNIGFGLRMRKLPLDRIHAQVGDMLERMHLTGHGQRRPVDLSGGQQQRVALARALILRPRVLLLDEPLSNLDAALKDEIRDLIGMLQRDFAITTIFVTHDQRDAVALADRVALLLDGRLRQHGTPSDLYRRPADEGVARFLGGTNFINGHAEGQVFHSAIGPFAVPPGLPTGVGTLTFRPESARLGQGTNMLRLTVTELRYLGTQTRVGLRDGDTRLEMHIAPDMAAGISVGESLMVHIPPEALWIMR